MLSAVTPVVSPVSVKMMVGGAAWWDHINRKVERAARRQQRAEEERLRAVAAARFSAQCGELVLDARNQLTLWWLQVGCACVASRLPASICHLAL